MQFSFLPVEAPPSSGQSPLKKHHRICTRLSEHRLLISISDNGRGILPRKFLKISLNFTAAKLYKAIFRVYNINIVFATCLKALHSEAVWSGLRLLTDLGFRHESCSAHAFPTF